jgi:hypothetical protein
MNKRLEELLERVAAWPPGVQEDAVAALEGLEVKVNANQGLTLEEQQAKLESLRDMLRRSIARGGDYSPDDIDAMIDERFGEARVQGR